MNTNSRNLQVFKDSLASLDIGDPYAPDWAKESIENFKKETIAYLDKKMAKKKWWKIW